MTGADRRDEETKAGRSPSERDYQWTENVFRVLRIGGVWASSFAVYRKENENVVALILFKVRIPPSLGGG